MVVFQSFSRVDIASQYYIMELHPESTEQAFGTNLLRRENKTPNIFVMNLQICLIQVGYLDVTPGVDGYFCKETKAALAAYQKQHNLHASGEAGDITKSILWEEYSERSADAIAYKR